MTTATVPARWHRADSARQVPWRRMAWVTWRQHRVALTSMAVLLGALALYVWITGRQLHHAYAAATACHPADSAVCADRVSHFNAMDKILWWGYVLQPIPAIIGAFLGAPLLARELETGTFRYAWTQGFGAVRWTVAKLVGLAVVVAAAAGAIGALLSWYYQPYFSDQNHALSLFQMSPYAAGLFDLRGVGFAAWTLAAFAIGCLAGMLSRRVVVAIVTTLTVYAVLAVVVANFLRVHYLTPLVTKTLNVPGSAWIISQRWTKDGRFVFAGRPPIDVAMQLCPSSAVGAGKPSPASIPQCLVQHGYTQLTRYQPISRFWSFQWIEAGWLVALSTVLIVTTVWLVRRRPG